MEHTGRRSSLIALTLLTTVTTGVYAAPAGAASDPVITADLEGQPIPAVDIALYACQDFDFPRIHCYRTRAELERVVADLRTGPMPSGADAAAGATATGYVEVFPDKGLQGLPAVLSIPYENLSVIGWNDRISSFKGLAGAGGMFYQNSYGGGWPYAFDAYQIVTYVGDAYNDTFSSVTSR